MLTCSDLCWLVLTEADCCGMNRFRSGLLLPRLWNYDRPTHPPTWVGSRDAAHLKNSWLRAIEKIEQLHIRKWSQPSRCGYWKSDGEKKSSNEVPSADEAKIVPVSEVQELWRVWEHSHLCIDSSLHYITMHVGPSLLPTKKARKGNSRSGGDSIENMFLVDILNHQLHLQRWRVLQELDTCQSKEISSKLIKTYFSNLTFQNILVKRKMVN